MHTPTTVLTKFYD